MYIQYPQQAPKSRNALFLSQKSSSKPTSFCAEIKDEFVKGSESNTITDSEKIEALNKELQNCRVLLSIAKAKDILSRAVDISKDLWQKKGNLDKSWRDISYSEELIKSSSIKRARDKYNIENKEYGINNCADRVEQLAVVTLFLNNNKDKFSGLTSSTPEEITDVLRNNKGEISNESLCFIEKLVEVYGRCAVSELLETIRFVKDDSGNMDLEKMSAFMSYFSCEKSKNASVLDAIDFVKRNYPDKQNSFEANMELTQRMEDYILQINKSTNIDDLIDILDLKKVGLVPKSKIKSILDLISEYSQEYNKRSEYNMDRINDVFGDIEAKKILAESAIRGFYDVNDRYVSSYPTLGEQMRVVGNFLNSNEEKLCSVTKDTTESIVKSLQNKDGIITGEDMIYLQEIFEMASGKCDVTILPEIIKATRDIPKSDYENLKKLIDKIGMQESIVPQIIDLIKNKEGGIDPEKEGAFIAYLNTHEDFLKLAIDFIKHNYPPELSEKQTNPFKIASAQRAIDNVTDSSVKTYYTLGEQLQIVGDFLSNNRDKLRRTRINTTEEIVKALQNIDGDITYKDIEFLDNVLAERDSIEARLIPTLIKLVKDENGNLDRKKVMGFLTKYAWIELPLPEIMEYMNKEYNSDSPELSAEIQSKTKEVEDVIADEVAYAKAEEKQQVKELVNRINSIVTNYGFQCFNAHINKSTGKIIVKCNRHDKGTVFDFHPGCYDMKDIVDDFTFSHIEEIDGDVCFRAENINIGCPLHITGTVWGYMPNGFHNITAGRYGDFWTSKTNNTHQ